MNISELKAGARNVTLEARVVEKDDPREVVTKYGKRLNVANITLKDDTGSIVMSLWGNDIDLVSVGDKIRVTNGYVTEFRGTPQLSAGKFGKLEVIERSGKSDELGDTEGIESSSSDEDPDAE
ncbi:MAG: OB-fold nucleic acid binding domain-containing protein [Candidatus Micrarchaeia archaeon]